MKHIALLRGINVGGNNKVPMSDLKNCFQSAGFNNISTYINSGNVIFETSWSISTSLTKIQSCLREKFSFDIQVVLIEASRLQKIPDEAPKWWGEDPSWKHNALFVIPPTTVEEIVTAIGKLKPGIEAIQAGDGLVYQSMSFENFGKTTTGKLASNPIYKQLTIRNYNTVQKLIMLTKTD